MSKMIFKIKKVLTGLRQKVYLLHIFLNSHFFSKIAWNKFWFYNRKITLQNQRFTHSISKRVDFYFYLLFGDRKNIDKSINYKQDWKIKKQIIIIIIIIIECKAMSRAHNELLSKSYFFYNIYYFIKCVL
jgi:hypothetical protein